MRSVKEAVFGGGSPEVVKADMNGGALIGINGGSVLAP